MDIILKEINSYIARKDKKREKVSSRSIGWHIEHSLHVVSSVISALRHSNPEEYQTEFSVVKSYVFTKEEIPRGTAKSPEEFISEKDDFETEELKELLEKVTHKLTLIENLDENAFFPHPFLGNLNKKDTLTFIRIHTIHHLKIMKDIVFG